MRKNIGEFSWRGFIFSVVLCLAPAIGVYRLFSFQRSAPAADATPALLDLQRQLDELKQKCVVQNSPVIKMPTAEHNKSSKKR